MNRIPLAGRHFTEPENDRSTRVARFAYSMGCYHVRLRSVYIPQANIRTNISAFEEYRNTISIFHQKQKYSCRCLG